MIKSSWTIACSRFSSSYLCNCTISGLSLREGDESAIFFNFHRDIDNVAELVEMLLEEIFSNGFSGNKNCETSFRFLLHGEICLLVALLLLLKGLIKRRNWARAAVELFTLLNYCWFRDRDAFVVDWWSWKGMIRGRFTQQLFPFLTFGSFELNLLRFMFLDVNVAGFYQFFRNLTSISCVFWSFWNQWFLNFRLCFQRLQLLLL